MSSFGGVLSFELIEGMDAVEQVLPCLRYAHLAPNLGQAETTVSPPSLVRSVVAYARELDSHASDALSHASDALSHTSDALSHTSDVISYTWPMTAAATAAASDAKAVGAGGRISSHALAHGDQRIDG